MYVCCVSIKLGEEQLSGIRWQVDCSEQGLSRSEKIAVCREVVERRTMANQLRTRLSADRGRSFCC